MIEVARLTYTGVIDLLNLPLQDFVDIRMALINVMEREASTRAEARNN